MADQVLSGLPEEIVPDDGDLLYVVRNSADRKMTRGVLVAGLTPTTRALTTQNGIKGGGDLTADRTLELDISGLTDEVSPVAAADFVAIHSVSNAGVRKVRLDRLPGGSGGETASNSFSTIAVPGQTSATATSATDTLTIAAGSNISISTNASTDTLTFSATGLTPTSRTISAGGGLTGGGDLTANRSIALNINGQSEDLAPTLANHFIVTHDSTLNAFRKIKASLLGGGTYVLPAATSEILGGVKIGTGLTVDVNGLLKTTYTLPAASSTTLGGVIAGTGLSVTSGGTLSTVLPNASSTTLGVVIVGSGLSITGSGVLSALPYTLPISSASILGGIKIGTGLSIDGTGVVSVTGGGGGGGTFATQVEAEGGLNEIAYMSPLRTKQAIEAYGETNKVTGVEGQVVGFTSAGVATPVKSTRSVLIPVYVETASVATGTAIRKFKFPMSLKLTHIEVYTPTAGSTPTTIDIIVGTSIFSSQPSVSANTTTTNVITFATASITKAQVMEVNVIAAGTGAKGLWVNITGIEV